jgi:hypothetical protein
MEKNKELPTGIIGFAMVILGIIGRIYVSVAYREVTLDSMGDLEMIVTSMSYSLLFIGGLISIFGAVKYKKRKWGIAGALLSALFIILPFLSLLSGRGRIFAIASCVIVSLIVFLSFE